MTTRTRANPGWLITIAVLVGCPSKPPVTEQPDIPPAPTLPDGDGPGTPLGEMCANLRALHCEEGEPITKNGKTRTCYQWTTVARSPMPIDCVTRARTQQQVRDCGDRNREITFRCIAP